MSIRPLFILRFAGIALLLGQLLVWYPTQAIRDDYGDTDLILFHNAAINAAHGRPVYGETRANVAQMHKAFFYAPTFLVLMRPTASLDIVTLAKIWFAVILVAFWMFAWALARLAFPYRYRLDHVLAMGVAVQCIPQLHWTMSLGNVDLIVWALVAWAFNAPRTWAAIALLLFASWIKVYPIFGIPILFLLRFLRDESDDAFLMMLVLGTGSIATIAVIDLSGYGNEWLQVGLPSITAGCFFQGNLSLPTLAIWPFIDTSAATIPHWAQRFLSIAPLVGIGLVAVAVTRKLRARAHAAAVITVALWLSPVCWSYQIGIAAINIALWWQGRHVPSFEHWKAARTYLIDAYEDDKRAAFVTSTFAASPRTWRAYQAAVALGADPVHAAEEMFPEIVKR